MWAQKKILIAIVTFAVFFLSTNACSEYAPVKGHIITKWGEQVTPGNAWRQYPRPALQRENWMCLNGLWDYAVSSKDADAMPEPNGRILVPFSIESALSGVGKRLKMDDALWYQRTLPVTKKQGKRYLLNFEAVDYESTVWINDKQVGHHTGGNLPFQFDVTDALVSGENTVRVRVTDATNTQGQFQLHGKQVNNPDGIWYTPVSGIWQTVWLEEVPDVYISGLKMTPAIDGEVKIEVATAGSIQKTPAVTVVASLNGKEVAHAQSNTDLLTLTIPSPQLWSPDSPTLYDLKIRVAEDSVQSYIGLRETGIERDANGHRRFTLNGKPIFHWGPLDQGWWPDGLLTPPSDEAMVSDIKFLKAAGFNTIRKHIKVEPRRYYTHCDRIGMLMWQDQVSHTCRDYQPRWTRLDPNPEKVIWPQEAHTQFMAELKGMIDGLYNHPCIVVWVPFNEAWGQHQVMETGKWTVEYDPTRQVNIASGGNWWPVGHIVDHHQYPHPGFPFHLSNGRFNDYVKVVGEFGGHGFPVEGHLWDPGKSNWGYGGMPKSIDEWQQRYTTSINALCGLKMQGIAAGIYTQTTDVEGEVNGLLTYDRIEKVKASWLKPLSEQLLKTPDVAKISPLVPTCESRSVPWKYTTTKPSEDWMKAGYDDRFWKTGRAGFGTRQTPDAPVNSEWDTSDIWLRHHFELSSVPEGLLSLRFWHDEDAQIYLNGKQILAVEGYTTRYQPFLLDNEARSALKTGANVLAVHCTQTTGGQFIDVGLEWLQ